VVNGLPAGLGEPVFDKMDAMLAHAILSIGATRGIEFGDGFALAEKKGSQVNDQMGASGFLSNHAGGINGGITNGQPIVFRTPVKPTASISIPQKTIDIDGNEQTIVIEGRHDPCICVRITVLSLWYEKYGR
jgi:chorismate synthase